MTQAAKEAEKVRNKVMIVKEACEKMVEEIAIEKTLAEEKLEAAVARLARLAARRLAAQCENRAEDTPYDRSPREGWGPAPRMHWCMPRVSLPNVKSVQCSRRVCDGGARAGGTLYVAPRARGGVRLRGCIGVCHACHSPT